MILRGRSNVRKGFELPPPFHFLFSSLLFAICTRAYNNDESKGNLISLQSGVGSVCRLVWISRSNVHCQICGYLCLQSIHFSSLSWIGTRTVARNRQTMKNGLRWWTVHDLWAFFRPRVIHSSRKTDDPLLIFLLPDETLYDVMLTVCGCGEKEQRWGRLTISVTPTSFFALGRKRFSCRVDRNQLVLYDECTLSTNIWTTVKLVKIKEKK